MMAVRTAMLVEHATSLPVGADWEYEYVWPGERVLVSKEGANVRLTPVPHRRDLTNRFPVIAALVAKLGADRVLIDGVVGPVEADVLSHIGGQATVPQPGSGVPIALIASDLLLLGHRDVRPLPLEERARLLRDLVASAGIIVPFVPTVGVGAMLDEARRLGAEAVLAKRRESRYRPFGRSGDWLRVAVDPPPARTGRSAGDRQPVLHRGPQFGRGGPLGLGQMA